MSIFLHRLSWMNDSLITSALTQNVLTIQISLGQDDVLIRNTDPKEFNDQKCEEIPPAFSHDLALRSRILVIGRRTEEEARKKTSN